MKVKNVVLVDLSTYNVNLQGDYLALKTKLQILQTISWKQRTGFDYNRPGLSYSRGLLLLAACLLRNSYEVHYVVYADPSDRALLDSYISEAHVACFMAITPTIRLAFKLAHEFKQTNSNIKIIVGGPHSTSLPIQTMREFDVFDYVMEGNSEERLPKLLSKLDKPDEVPGVFFRYDGDVYSSSIAVEPVDLGELPIPAYEVLSRPLSQYAHNLQTSRGCLFQCDFCVEGRSLGKVYSHDTKQILEELDLLADKLPPNTLVHFSDSVFNPSNIETSRLLYSICRLKLHQRLSFSCDTRVDLIYEPQIRELVQSGFILFRLGFESSNNNVLRSSQKNTRITQQIQISKMIRSVSNRSLILAYLITGLPGTTPAVLAEDVDTTYRQAKDGLFDIASDKVMVPYPGTDYFEKSKEHGIDIVSFNWDAYDRLSFPVYRLLTLSSDDIYKGFIARETALAKGYFDRMRLDSNELTKIKPLEDYFYLSYLRKSDTKST